MRKLAHALVVTSLLAAPALAQTRDAPIAATVEADKPGATIDRNLFGQFAENLGHGLYGGIWVGRDSPIPNTRGIRNDVVAALRALHVPNVRWPGGCFADEYHWQDGVGPAASRRTTVNAAWGGVLDDNGFGTDEFMDFADQIGAEAYISVNLGSGSVREAADWVDYLTAAPETSAGKARAANGHRAPYKVRFLGLGNESWSCGGAMTPDYYTDLMKRYARFVRNYNPAQTGAEAMRRIAVGPPDGDPAYTEGVMQAWKKHDWSWNIEGLSLHHYTVGGWPPHYPSTGFGEDDYAALLQETLGMDAIIALHSAIMDKYDPKKEVPLVVDEWGAWLAPMPGSNPAFLVQQNSLRDAILAALNLNIFARHADRVRGANIAQMVNVLQSMILTDGGRMVLTPTYHVFRMYLPFQDASFVPLTLDAGSYVHGAVTLPRVDAIAAKAKDGRIWLALTNLDPARPATIRATIAGIRAKGARGELLTAPAVDSVNGFDRPDLVRPVPYSARANDGVLTLELPAKSVVVVAIEE